jgi:alpha-L-rhamnosidase
MVHMNRRDFLSRIGLTTAGLLILQSGSAMGAKAEPSSGGEAAISSAKKAQAEFAAPPFEYGPWVYWFWLDVNVTREGITADLEAMKAVGIAGVLIMDVDQGTPPSFNGSRFGDPEWYELFQFACHEADRLGMQVNMSNDAGFCGSGGPWITPELSMQVVVWSTTVIAGGKSVNTTLPQPNAKMNFYRDIAVLAFSTPAADQAGRGYRIPNIGDLTDSFHGHDHSHTQVNWESIPADQLVRKSAILNLTDKMDEHGMLHCELPAGDWTILRFGHTTTGVQNRPAPAGGLGLESDTLSRTATLLQFEALMARITKTVGPLAGKTLVSTHIDSWESDTQNWTPTMRQDFQRLRGYDLLPYMPILAGHVVDSLEISQRFLWDFRGTIGDLLLENYAAAMREVAHKHGLRLSIEGYSGEPANDIRYGGEADEPMAECWASPRFHGANVVREMTSAGHVYGKNIIAQETFTTNRDERWLGHPAVFKDIGDWTFCVGINRFVFHRYAMQPWTNPHHSPGMCMGSWGLHYERTQTWWHMSKSA